ncbi:MAG: response regulator [Candidatus Zixiibacteriota bacterium]
MRILLVEDDPAAIKVCVAVCSEAGYEVVVVNSRKSAINQLNGSAFFDIIILGLFLPGMDSFQFLEYLQSNHRFNKTPVLATSVLHDKDTVVRCAELGVKEIIIKPVESQILIAKIQHIYERFIKSVVVVDGDPLIRNLLKKILEREGYKTIMAESAQEVLEILETNRVGMVITGLEPSGMSGMELTVAIKEKNANVPVFVITGKSQKFDNDYVIQSGADGYISKPFKNFEIARRLAPFLA